MAGVNISNFGAAFTRYLQGVTDTLQNKSKLRSMIKKDDKWTGDHIEFFVHTARNHALGNVQDGGAFPSPDKQDYVAAKAYRKFLVGAVQLTDGVMATAGSGKNVARDVVTSEIKGMMDGMMKYENGMLFRDGTGAVAQLQTAQDLTGVTTNITVDDARMLWEGAPYEIHSDLGTSLGTATVSDVESALSSGNALVNLSNYTGSATGVSDYFVWKGSYNNAITGLDSLVDDSATTFQKVPVDTYPRYSSLVLGNSGTNRDLTPFLFRALLAGIKQKSGAESPSDGLTCIANSWQLVNLEELYEGELRMTPDSKVGGFAVSSFQSALGKINLVADVDALYNKIFAVDLSKIYRAVQKELAWRRDGQGGSIFKRSDTSGVYTATAIEICELYIKERFTSGKLEDLNHNAVTAY